MAKNMKTMKLALGKETLRSLGQRNLAQVVGGGSYPAKCQLPSAGASCGCDTTTM